jgi:hypothetical protein
VTSKFFGLKNIPFFLFVIIVAYDWSSAYCQKSFQWAGIGFKMLRQWQITAQ